MLKSKVLFIMSGSIACYKACNVLSKLVQKGCDVQVVATSSALKFIGNATIEGLTGKPVISDLFAAGNVMDHIHLARWADLVLVAPASANLMNKMAYGIADDLTTTLFLAHDFTKPFLVAPAMNTAMYKHPATQESLKRLEKMGVRILESASGILACGETGYGRLLEPEKILEILEPYLEGTATEVKPQIAPQASATLPYKILVTAGGTSERIDDVRVLSNTSTGFTGYKLAHYLMQAGFDVELLKSNTAQVPVTSEFPVYEFSDYQSLEARLKDLLSKNSYTHVIHAAAVSDYSVEKLLRGDAVVADGHKLDSSQDLTIHLKKNPKLLQQIKAFSKNPGLKVIGFKLTSHADSEDVIRRVEAMLKDVDFVVHNDVVGIDKASGVHIFSLWGLRKPRTYENVEQLSVGIIHAISFEVKP